MPDNYVNRAGCVARVLRDGKIIFLKATVWSNRSPFITWRQKKFPLASIILKTLRSLPDPLTKPENIFYADGNRFNCSFENVCLKPDLVLRRAGELLADGKNITEILEAVPIAPQHLGRLAREVLQRPDLTRFSAWVGQIGFLADEFGGISITDRAYRIRLSAEEAQKIAKLVSLVGTINS